MNTAASWGRHPKYEQQQSTLSHPNPSLPPEGLLLPYGLGRSYGDSCQNEHGHLLKSRLWDRFISFDTSTGMLECEGGVTLDCIIKYCLPHGWFLPVTPGTKYVTIGGAIANDVHGKNHHKAGSFGNHVAQFDLMNSSGTVTRCSRSQQSDLFRATIGGLGLTGFILRAKVQLKRVESTFMNVETIKFANLDEFQALSSESANTHEYTVAWLDCISGGENLGRGIFFRANHAPRTGAVDLLFKPRSNLSVPFPFPNFALNSLTMKTFNKLYYHRVRRKRSNAKEYFDGYFYPLDTIKQWNFIYGRRGFLQYQFVIPVEAYETLKFILQDIVEAGSGSFLAVLKEFGGIESEGLLSFSRPGVSLALDFPNDGEKTHTLLKKLDQKVAEVGGAIYPAKDARMAPQMFRTSYPNLDEFVKFVDERFSSSFWRRVMEISR